MNTQALASELGGQTVAITSGQDIRLNGANVLADQDLGIHAGGNLTIDAAQNTFSETHFQDTQKSGLFGSGIGYTIGSQQQQSDAQSTATFAAPSTVGSLGGNVTLSAGDTYTQIGSDVLAPMGDITIAANTVNIQEARETSHSQTEQRFKQGGLSFSLSSPVVDTAQRLQGQINAAGDTQSSRMQALAAANSALAVTDIQQQLQSGQGTDLNLNISLGSSESRSNSTSDSDTARGSSLIAGGNLAIHALGEGEGEGNITVQGSQLDAGNQMLLNATHDINLLASADTASHRSSHSSSSASVGLGIGLNGGSPGINLNLAASQAKGHGNGDSTTYNNTQLTAGNQVTLNSGGDTTLQGAVVSAPQITANIGGNLTIESLQDSATHNEHHESSGFSVSIPIYGAGQPNASVNASRTKIDSDYQSVNEQSGFRAGDGGFQVNVEGLTTLTGGAITSTDVAVDAGNNHFTTAGQTATEAVESGALTLSDIDNRASYEAESTSVGLSAGQGGVGLSGIGVGRDDGDASSTTLAAISGLAGDQDARTGDAETGITPIFDADQVQQDVQAQAAITQAFGSQASQAWGDYANDKWLDAMEIGDADASACWAADGSCRSVGHLLIGGASGGVDGALGAGVSTQLAPQVLDALQGSGLPQTAQDNLAMLIAATAGGAVGGMDGVAAGYNEAANNATYTLALCRATPVCVSALSGVLGGSAATALLEGDTSITGDPSTDALAIIALERALEAALFLSDVTSGERTEYPAETDTLPLGTGSPATPIDRPGRYDTPIVEQEGWSSELPIAGPAYGDHAIGGGYQILDPETQQLIGGAVYSENGFDLPVRASSFEESLYKLPPGERVAVIKQAAIEAASYHGLQKDSRLSRMNNRDVYISPDGAVYSLDTQHGRFEKINPRTGRHEGEVRLYDLEPVPGKVDRSGGHNLRVR